MLPRDVAQARQVIANENLKDIRAGSYGSNAYLLTDAGGTLFFIANNGLSDVELWKSDGSAAGIVRVKDIRPGFSDSRDSIYAFNPHVDLLSAPQAPGRSSDATYAELPELLTSRCNRTKAELDAILKVTSQLR